MFSFLCVLRLLFDQILLFLFFFLFSQYSKLKNLKEGIYKNTTGSYISTWNSIQWKT